MRRRGTDACRRTRSAQRLVERVGNDGESRSREHRVDRDSLGDPGQGRQLGQWIDEVGNHVLGRGHHADGHVDQWDASGQAGDEGAELGGLPQDDVRPPPLDDPDQPGKRSLCVEPAEDLGHDDLVGLFEREKRHPFEDRAHQLGRVLEGVGQALLHHPEGVMRDRLGIGVSGVMCSMLDIQAA